MIKILWAIIVAFVLKLFNVDFYVIQVIGELTGIYLSNAGYIGLFAVVGILRWIVSARTFHIDYNRIADNINKG